MDSLEFSIYDEDTSNMDKIFTYQDLNQANLTPKQENLMSINLDKYTNIDNLEKIAINVQEVNQSLDIFIENLKKQDIDSKIVREEETRERSDSAFSTKSSVASFETGSFSFGSKLKGRGSNSSLASNESSVEFSFLDLHSCVANSFSINSSNIPSFWYDLNVKSISSSEFKFKEKEITKNTEWRNNILNYLIHRNIKEHQNIDKITKPYENDVKLVFF